MYKINETTIEILDGGRVSINGEESNYRWAFGMNAVNLTSSQRENLGEFDWTIWYDKANVSIEVGNVHSKISELTIMNQNILISHIFSHFIFNNYQTY